MNFPWWRPAAWRGMARKGEWSKLEAMLDWLRALRVERPLRLTRPGRTGRRLVLERPEAFRAALSGAGPPYSWSDVLDPARAGVGNAWPYNGETGLAGAVVWLQHKPTSGDYRFEVLRHGGCKVQVCLYWLCGRPVPACDFTLTKGATVIAGTTDPGGCAVVDIAAGGPGTYTLASDDGRVESSASVNLNCYANTGLSGPNLPPARDLTVTITYTGGSFSIPLTYYPSIFSPITGTNVTAWTYAAPGSLGYYCPPRDYADAWYACLHADPSRNICGIGALCNSYIDYPGFQVWLQCAGGAGLGLYLYYPAQCGFVTTSFQGLYLVDDAMPQQVEADADTLLLNMKFTGGGGGTGIYTYAGDPFCFPDQSAILF